MSTALPFRATEFWGYRYRRMWKTVVVASTINPILFLASMGFGLGKVVDASASASRTATLGGVDYLTFLAPGLLAAASMQLAAQESAWPVLGAIKWDKAYYAMLATPLRVVDVLLGHVFYIAARLLFSATVFFLVMVAFGAIDHWTAVFSVLAATLTGLAFATPLMAYASTLTKDTSLSSVQRFVIMPMFLFSGTFFPVSQLPSAIRWVAYVVPAWHGVSLSRSLALGSHGWLAMAGHAAFLAALTGAGLAFGRRSFERRLAP